MMPPRRSSIIATWSWSLNPRTRARLVDSALLVMRLSLAWIFIYYGAGKLFNVFSGPGLHETSIFFATTAHLHPGGFFAVLTGVVECFGGLFVGIGLAARLWALALALDMLGAMVTVTFQHGLVGTATATGYGLNVALGALAIAVVLMGAGRFSVDAVIADRARR